MKQCWKKFSDDHKYAGMYYESTIAEGVKEEELTKQYGIVFKTPPKKELVTDLDMLVEQFEDTKQGWKKIQKDIDVFSVPAKADHYGRTMDSLARSLEVKLQAAKSTDGPNRKKYFKAVGEARTVYNSYKDNLKQIEDDVEGVLREANTIRVANMLAKQDAKLEAKQAATKE